jgi:predicted phage gp36 major capsid-like protein
MANQIPLSGASNAAGGYLLPPEQGEILTNGILLESGALQLAGDRRTTKTRKTQYPIWLGQPTAGPVGEGAKKPPTGAELGQTAINIKKFATYVIFTDEMIEDLQAGDLNVLVDSGVRSAINDSIDAHALGLDSGAAITGVFDSELTGTTSTVEWVQGSADGLEKAVSAALGVLEGNGYGNPGQQAILLGFGFAQKLRDARKAVETTDRVYGDTVRDPLYNRQNAVSTNLNTATEAAGAGKVVGLVAYKPNIHVRVRSDVSVKVSTEATVSDGSTDRNAFEENLTVIRYETRLGVMAHDLNRAVVAIINAA